MTVVDDNDNVPQFTDDPAIYGVSVEAPANWQIATLQVTLSFFCFTFLNHHIVLM